MNTHIHEDLLMSLFFLAVGATFFLSSGALASETTYFPLLCAGAMMILCVPVLIRGIQKTIEMNRDGGVEKGNPTALIAWKKLKGPVLTFLMVIAYALCISKIGFFVSTFFFMPGFMYFQHYRKPVAVLVITLGFEVLLYLVFVLQLHLRLPKGLLF